MQGLVRTVNQIPFRIVLTSLLSTCCAHCV